MNPLDLEHRAVRQLTALNKSRTFEDIQKTIKINLTKVRDKGEGAG